MQKLLAIIIVVSSTFTAGMWFQRGMERRSPNELSQVAYKIQQIIQIPEIERGIFYALGIGAGIWVGMRIERRKSKVTSGKN